MIVIVDYGLGNLRSAQKGFEKAGHEAVISSDQRLLQMLMALSRSNELCGSMGSGVALTANDILVHTKGVPSKHSGRTE